MSRINHELYDKVQAVTKQIRDIYYFGEATGETIDQVSGALDQIQKQITAYQLRIADIKRLAHLLPHG